MKPIGLPRTFRLQAGEDVSQTMNVTGNGRWCRPPGIISTSKTRRGDSRGRTRFPSLPHPVSTKKNRLESLAFQGTISTETWWAQ